MLFDVASDSAAPGMCAARPDSALNLYCNEGRAVGPRDVKPESAISQEPVFVLRSRQTHRTKIGRYDFWVIVHLQNSPIWEQRSRPISQYDFDNSMPMEFLPSSSATNDVVKAPANGSRIVQDTGSFGGHLQVGRQPVVFT